MVYPTELTTDGDGARCTHASVRERAVGVIDSTPAIPAPAVAAAPAAAPAPASTPPPPPAGSCCAVPTPRSTVFHGDAEGVSGARL